MDKAGSPYSLSNNLIAPEATEWDEMINICRISYAVSRKWIPQSFTEIEKLVGKDNCEPNAPEFDYDDLVKIIDAEDFKDVTNRIFHDAVESTARIWYRAWDIFTK